MMDLVTLNQQTHSSGKQLLPVRFEIEDDTPPGPGQGGPTDEQDQEDQIGKGSSHPNYLIQKAQNLFNSNFNKPLYA